MTELQAALQQLTGWLEDGETLDRFAEYLGRQSASVGSVNETRHYASDAREANRIFDVLREAAEFDL